MILYCTNNYLSGLLEAMGRISGVDQWDSTRKRMEMVRGQFIQRAGMDRLLTQLRPTPKIYVARGVLEKYGLPIISLGIAPLPKQENRPKYSPYLRFWQLFRISIYIAIFFSPVIVLYNVDDKLSCFNGKVLFLFFRSFFLSFSLDMYSFMSIYFSCTSTRIRTHAGFIFL